MVAAIIADLLVGSAACMEEHCPIPPKYQLINAIKRKIEHHIGGERAGQPFERDTKLNF